MTPQLLQILGIVAPIIGVAITAWFTFQSSKRGTLQSGEASFRTTYLERLKTAEARGDAFEAKADVLEKRCRLLEIENAQLKFRLGIGNDP